MEETSFKLRLELTERQTLLLTHLLLRHHEWIIFKMAAPARFLLTVAPTVLNRRL